MQVRHEVGVTVISSPWRNSLSVFLLFLSVAFNAFFLYLVISASLYSTTIPFARIVIVASLALPFGLCFFYGALAHVFNRTEIRIGQGFLKTSNRPFPWWGTVKIRIDRIKEVLSGYKVLSSNRGDHTHFTVEIETVEGQRLEVISSLPTRILANEVTAEIRKHLNL